MRNSINFIILIVCLAGRSALAYDRHHLIGLNISPSVKLLKKISNKESLDINEDLLIDAYFVKYGYIISTNTLFELEGGTKINQTKNDYDMKWRVIYGKNQDKFFNLYAGLGNGMDFISNAILGGTADSYTSLITWQFIFGCNVNLGVMNFELEYKNNKFIKEVGNTSTIEAAKRLLRNEISAGVVVKF